MAGSFTLPTVLANLTAGNQPLTLIDGDLNALANPLLALGTFSNYYADTGAANAYVITVPAPQTVSQAAGLQIQFLATNANTGASTLQINALAAKNIVNLDGTALALGQIPASALVTVMYDGASYQLQSVVSSTTAASSTNLLVNPNWQIDQINEGALYTVNTTDVRGPDGWSGTAVGAGVFKLRTLADPDNAALKCMEISCTTADAAIAAGDDYFVYSAIEGYDAAALQAGTASAQSIIIQFKFKSNLTGVYGISIANSALNRRYIGIITVASTSEAEYVTKLTLDTTGTWLYTTGVGMYFRICLSAGTNFQAAAGAWAAGAEQTTSAQCNFMSLNTNIAYLKRIRLFQGTVGGAYPPANIQSELAKAQRYYCKTFSQGTAPAQNAGVTGTLQFDFPTGGTTTGGVYWRFPQTMRVAPTTVTSYNPSAAAATWRDVTNGADRAVTVDPRGAIGDGGVYIEATAGVANAQMFIHVSATARIS